MANEQGLVERFDMLDHNGKVFQNPRGEWVRYSALEAKDTELAELRAIVSQVCDALGNGAVCASAATIGFMKHVPNEVRLVVDGLRERATAAEAALDRARNDALEEAARMLEEGYDRVPGKLYRADETPSKNDQCAHGSYGWEDCEQCAVVAVRNLKTEPSATASPLSDGGRG